MIPFWLQESKYLSARNDLEWECEHAKTLAEAVRTGANMVWVDNAQVGWLNEDGTLSLYEDFKGKEDMPVEFYSLDRDDDGYTIALFKRKGGE